MFMIIIVPTQGSVHDLLLLTTAATSVQVVAAASVMTSHLAPDTTSITESEQPPSPSDENRITEEVEATSPGIPELLLLLLLWLLTNLSYGSILAIYTYEELISHSKFDVSSSKEVSASTQLQRNNLCDLLSKLEVQDFSPPT
ncbi:unnamed protein product [Microthlaspi erraticum]|uniref:Nodulin-like domain-containing protein n=1 Tax=Microthlaspi erraticum TaxID=1685480 RepID=A0A6D2KS98_9BRAS|nr:unnamed protein product [Microthlaspi erraticum]CAA7047298.1 unnamed protein product [Microthlaspi erraticum]CAA7050356.1 unnamed protein product [Microthlaspi erraticum]